MDVDTLVLLKARLNRPTLNAVCSVDAVEFRPHVLLLNKLVLLCCSSNDFGLTSLDLAARSILRNTSRGMEYLFIGLFFFKEQRYDPTTSEKSRCRRGVRQEEAIATILWPSISLGQLVSESVSSPSIQPPGRSPISY